MNLIKDKRNRIIKGRTCADGSKKSYLKEVESISSTTVSLEAVFCTLLYDAHEGRDVATLKFP